MRERFFEDPILNSPFERPLKHWELDKDGIQTQQIVKRCRKTRLITPIPKPKKRGGKEEQRDLEFEVQGVAAESGQQYEDTQQVNSIRALVEERRQAPESQWKVTAETAQLLNHWRNVEFEAIRPFFCQIKAVETLFGSRRWHRRPISAAKTSSKNLKAPTSRRTSGFSAWP